MNGSCICDPLGLAISSFASVEHGGCLGPFSGVVVWNQPPLKIRSSANVDSFMKENSSHLDFGII